MVLHSQHASMREERHVLCVRPRHASSFGMFGHACAYPVPDGVRAPMPLQDLLVAAALPAAWTVRLADQNTRPADRDDSLWADAVLVAGMHARPSVGSVRRRSLSFGCTAVPGVPAAGHVAVEFGELAGRDRTNGKAVPLPIEYLRGRGRWRACRYGTGANAKVA